MNKNHLHRSVLHGLLLLTGLTVMAGPADLSMNVKLRAGASMGNLRDDLRADNGFGFAVGVEYPLSKGAMFGDLGYNYYAGRDIVTIFPDPAWPSTATAANSANRRKNKLEGVSMRGGYRQVWFGDWSWQAGLSISRMAYTHEAIGKIVTGSGTFVGFATTPQAIKTAPGFFAGIQFGNPSSSIFSELNLITQGYTSVNYIPAVGGATEGTRTANRNGFGLELSVGFRL